VQKSAASDECSQGICMAHMQHVRQFLIYNTFLLVVITGDKIYL